MLRSLAAIALLIAAPAVPQTAPTQLQHTLYSDDTPPVRFQGEGAAIVLMVNPARIDELCGKAPAGMQTLACTRFVKGTPVIVMPNPCAFDADPYAHVLCHEKAHADYGWPADHGP